MAQAQPFRQAALDRLSTPERLDRTLLVTTSKAWLALVTLTAIAAATAVWSVKGEVSTYVKASGILLSRSGTVVDASSSGVGTVTRIIPEIGEVVDAGAVVAKLVNHEVAERHRSAIALVEERQRAVEALRRTLKAEDTLISQNVARQRERLRRLEGRSQQSLETARKRLDNHRELFEDRIVTRVTLDRSQQAFNRVERELFELLRERDDIESRELHRQSEGEARIADLESSLQAALRRANEFEILLDSQHVLAPVSGRITEIKVSVGAVLRAGQPVLSIKTGSEQLDVLIYLPPADGKRVEPGMQVLVTPSTVRREEYGSIKGRVERVSSFPVSLQGMIAVLQNQKLAESFSEAGPPYSGRVTLDTDPSTASGFAWTSPKGAGEKLSTGTLVDAEVKVDGQPPITLVVPLLKDVFGL